MLSTVLILFVSLFFAAMGVAALVKPAAILTLFGITTLPPDSRNEVRAVYGGFGIAVAALLSATLFYPALKYGALIAIAAALLGMAAGRVISALMEGQIGRYPSIFLVVECVLAAMLLNAL